MSVIRTFLRKVFSERLPYMQILFVFLAFGVMIAASSLFAGNIERGHLRRETEDTLTNIKTRLDSDMRELETMLGFVTDNIRNMLINGEDYDTVTAYITNVVEYGRDGAHLTGFVSIFAIFDIFDGEVFDVDAPDTGWTDSPGWTPSERPWYIAAVEAGGNITITDPYMNVRLNESVISFARALLDEDGTRMAIVTLDVLLDRIYDVVYGRFDDDINYWVLFDRNLIIMAHPERELVGTSINDINSGFADLSDEIRQGLPINEHRLTNFNNDVIVVTGIPVMNGWYLGLATQIDSYYANLRDMQWFLIIIGLLLAVVVSTILVRLHYKRAVAEEQKSVADSARVALEAAQTTTSALFRHAPIGLTIFDENFKFIDCNEAVLNLYGVTKEFYSTFFGSASHSPEFQPDGSNSREKAMEVIQRVMKGETVKLEWVHCLPDGTHFPVDLTMSRIRRGNKYVGLGYIYDMREQKQMVQKLLDADEETQHQLIKLNAVVRATKAGLYDVEIIDNDFLHPDNTLMFTDELRRMLGYTSEAEFPNTFDTWRNHLHYDDRDKAIEDVIRHITDKTGKTPYDVEYRMLKKNGEYTYFRACGEAIRDNDGNAIRISGALMDIGETKNILIYRELQLAKLNLIIETAKIGMVNMELDPKDPLSPNNHIEYSYEYKKLLGFADDEKTPNNLGDSRIGLVHPDDREAAFRAFSDHLLDKTGNTPFDIEQRLRKKNGEYAWFRTVGKAIRDHYGNPIRFVNAAFDLTETKNAIARNELQLAKIALINKAARIGLWEMETIWDDPLNAENIIMYSYAFREILGYADKDDFPNVMSSFINCLHPDDIKMVADALTRHIMDLTGNTPFFAEYQARKKNGEYVYIRATGESIRDENGIPAHTLGTIMDISEEKITLANTERLRQQAEDANRTKSEFLAHMSHEIRTPMNAVIGAAEIQLQKNTNLPDAQEAFNTIYSSGHLLLSIINDVLDLSKIESGKLEILNAKYDIPSIIYDTVHLNLLRYESRTLDFNLKIDENTPLHLFGDEMRIKQIINNILSNAFKYTDEGEVEFSVSAIIESEKDCTLVLVVRDTGQGMTAEQVSKVFDAYERFNLESNRTIVGTGLGMNITYQLVEAMGGIIHVESEPGKGSVFTVHLPQKCVGTEVCGADLADKMRSENFANKTKLIKRQIVHEYMPYGSVLIVDDVDTNLYIAKGMMLPYGLKIETATSGIEAVNKIKHGSEYSVVFMDYMMPKMNGVEATRKIREMGYTYPIVALTANAVAGSADMFMENGFDGYISKPIDMRELSILLNRFVRDKQPQEVIEAARRQTANLQTRTINNPLSDAGLAKTVVRNFESSIVVLEKLYQEINSDPDAEVELYTITVHGIKGALANIGETDLSTIAYKLEQAGYDKDRTVILSETPSFIDTLRMLVIKYKPKEKSEPVEVTDYDTELLLEKLNAIKHACESYDMSEAENAFNELKPKAWPGAISDLLDEIGENLLCGKLKEVIATVDIFISTANEGT
ncbi:MAG: PAS domain-containing protein [Oscillospiraceae bacterium]|nr:PAS domain-containing protein [Oscillospiraceae bacterium]